jgi:hypothetical protein
LELYGLQHHGMTNRSLTTENDEELEDAVTSNPGVLETEGGSNVVHDASETPLRRETTLGGIPRRSFKPNMKVVRRNVQI